MSADEDFQYACPKCGSVELQVEVTKWRDLEQEPDGNLQTVEQQGRENDEGWDDSSQMACSHCRHVGVVKDFEVEAQAQEAARRC